MQKYPKWIDTGEKTALGEPIGKIAKNAEEEAAMKPAAKPVPGKPAKE